MWKCRVRVSSTLVFLHSVAYLGFYLRCCILLMLRAGLSVPSDLDIACTFHLFVERC